MQEKDSGRVWGRFFSLFSLSEEKSQEQVPPPKKAGAEGSGFGPKPQLSTEVTNKWVNSKEFLEGG